MSWRLMEAVLDLRLPDEQERILVRLARYAADDGTKCFPGIARLSVDSGRSERSVQRTLRALEGDGWVMLVANKYGGRGRTTEYQVMLSCAQKSDTSDRNATVKGDTDDTLMPDERVTQMTPIGTERVTPVVERVTPVVIKGDTCVTPIDQEQIIRTDQLKTTVAKKVTLSALSDDARTVLDDWRRKQGKTRAPELNPVLAKELESAVLDLGTDRLIEANTWAASEQVASLIKAIRAARTKRKRDETGAANGSGQRPKASPAESGYKPYVSEAGKQYVKDHPTWASIGRGGKP